MSDDIDVLKPDTVLKPKIEQPRLYKVVLINDDYTPREFVVQVLKAVFRTTEDQSYRIMMTGHQRGASGVVKRDSAPAREATGAPHSRQNFAPLGSSL
jgi:ATP-dependent Clp protease adaptor protein ClpS